jgi:putative membrane protein
MESPAGFRRLNGWVDDDEPDYRFTLANERTFLAWIRTALALLAAGVAVVHVIPDLGPKPIRYVTGLLLAGLALFVASTSHWRWREVDRAMRSRQPLPSSVMPVVLASGLSVAVLLAVVLILSG